MSLDRALLVLATLAFAGLVYLGMLHGWRARQRRQGDLPAPPAPPADPGALVAGAVPGLYVGTTTAQDWLDRIAVHGLGVRSAGWLSLSASGVHVEREGADELYLPWGAVDDVELGDALAGKVVGRGGLLILTWRLGGQQLLTGFRADDQSQHARLAAAVRAHLPTVPGQEPR